MEKKYRNVHTGDYVEKSNSEYYKLQSDGRTIPYRLIENSTDWIEVVQEPVQDKREWSILQFKNPEAYYIWVKKSDDQYTTDNGREYGTFPLSYMIDRNYGIHQVQYKDQIITVGDYIKHSRKPEMPVQKVEGIILNEYDHILLVTEVYQKGINISKVQKAEVIWTTEEGIPVCEDHPIHWIIFHVPESEWRYHGPYVSLGINHVTGKGCLTDKNNYRAFNTEAAARKWIAEQRPKVLITTEDGIDITDPKQWIYGVDSDLKANFIWAGAYKNDTWDKRYKWYSTEKARDEYIKENKPLLSVADIRELDQATPGHPIAYLSWHNINKTVEEKLKNNQ